MTPGAQQIVTAIRGWRGAGSLVVAIDGYGASGKTTLAAEVAAVLRVTVLHTDDHFRDASAIDDQRPMAQYYDWAAVRAELAAVVAPLIVVEGVSAAGAGLADLVTRTVFVDTPEPIRLERLHARISDEEWDEEWLAAEHVYFTTRPPESFDLVVPGSGVADTPA